MLDNYKSLPLIAGVSILFLIPIGIGAFAFSYLAGDSDTNPSNSSNEARATNKSGSSNSTPGLGGEDNLRVVPVPPSNDRGGGAIDSNEGIPIGKYSNPSTDIPVGEGLTPTTNRRIDDFDSSIDRNRAIQQSIDNNSTPDYNAPSSSNNYQMPASDNSLVTPLEDDSFLELPESSSDSEPAAIPTEPLFQP